MDWEKQNRIQRLQTFVDHYCPYCGMPLYSRLPICYNCFKKGRPTPGKIYRNLKLKAKARFEARRKEKRKLLMEKQQRNSRIINNQPGALTTQRGNPEWLARA